MIPSDTTSANTNHLRLKKERKWDSLYSRFILRIHTSFCECFCMVMFWLPQKSAGTLSSGFPAPPLLARHLAALEAGQRGSASYLWADPAVFMAGVSLSIARRV